MNNRFDLTPPMKLPSLLLFLLMTSACATSGEDPAVEGKSEHRIYCSGSQNTWDTCDQKAAQVCGGSEHEVVDRYEDRGALVAYDSARELPERILTIKCRH